MVKGYFQKNKDKIKNMLKMEEDNMSEEKVVKEAETVEAEIELVAEVKEDKKSEPKKKKKKAEQAQVEEITEIEVEVEAEVEIEVEAQEAQEEPSLTEEESVVVEKIVNQIPEVPVEVKKEDATSTLQGEAKNLLNKFKEYISGDSFDQKCEDKAKEKGLDKAVIKNAFIRNVLGTIADALNLAVSITGDVLKGALGFISNIIETVVNFGAATLHKLINLVTLNSGTVAY